MIFLAVGTQFGFDRLVRAVDKTIEEGLIREPVFAQIGPGQYRPRYMDYAISLEKTQFEKTLHGCRAMISHAGIGNISLALSLQKPLLVMPRLKKYNEVVNDHQVHTARKFEQLGHIVAVYEEKDLADGIRRLETFVPVPRIPNRQGVILRIHEFIENLHQKK